MIFNLLSLILILIWLIGLFWDYKTGKKAAKYVTNIQGGIKCYSCNNDIKLKERELSLTRFDIHMQICKNCARDQIISNVTNNLIKINGKGIDKGSLRYTYLKFLFDIRIDFIHMLTLAFTVFLTFLAAFTEIQLIISIIDIIHGVVLLSFWVRYLLIMIYGITKTRKLAIVK